MHLMQGTYLLPRHLSAEEFSKLSCTTPISLDCLPAAAHQLVPTVYTYESTLDCLPAGCLLAFSYSLVLWHACVNFAAALRHPAGPSWAALLHDFQRRAHFRPYIAALAYVHNAARVNNCIVPALA
jgi:hypothetical protein